MYVVVIFIFLFLSCSSQDFAGGDIREPKADQSSSAVLESGSQFDEEMDEASESGDGQAPPVNGDLAEEVSAPVSITGGYLTCAINDLNQVSCHSEQAISRTDLEQFIFLDQEGIEIPLENMVVEASQSDGTYMLIVTVPGEFVLEQILSRHEIDEENNNPPTFSSVSPLSATEDTAQTILYMDLLNAADVSDPDGNLLYFEFNGALNGVLTSDGVNPVTLGDRLGPGMQWVWQPPLNAQGNDQPGFSVRASDGALPSLNAVEVRFNVTAIDDAPSLSTVSNMVATEDTQVTITYEQLSLAADESDADGATIQFELAGINSGTLTTDGSTAVSLGALLSPGGQWIWLPPTDQNGDDNEGFTIRAYDGSLLSSSPVPVRFNIAAVNDLPNPGGDGSIMDSTVTFTSLSLSWVKATDRANETAQANLSYCVYRSPADMTSVAEAEAATLVGACGNDLDSISDSGLTPSTDYYYSVVVQDQDGGKSIYSSLYAPTMASFHIVYNDWRSGSDNRLKYARNTSGSLAVDTVLFHDVRIRHVDFDIDASNDLHILYFDDANNDDNTGTLNYLSGSVSGGFSGQRINETREMREGSDISVEDNGTVHIIHNEEWCTGNMEHTLYYTTGVGGALGTPELVTSANPSDDQGWGIDSFVDSAGTLHFSYLDEATGAFRYGEGTSGNFNLSSIQSNATSHSGSVTIIDEGSDGAVHVVYFDGDTGTNNIYYENNGNNWAGNSMIAVANADAERSLDMALDSDDNVHLCYRHNTDGDTYYATNASGAWLTERIHNGSADPGGEGCATCSIDVGSKRNVVHITYYTSCTSRDIRHAYGSLGNWTDILIDSNGESYNFNHELIVE